MLQKLPCVACHTQGKEVHSELLYRSFENSYTRPPSPKYVAMQDLGRVWRCLQGSVLSACLAAWRARLPVAFHAVSC